MPIFSLSDAANGHFYKDYDAGNFAVCCPTTKPDPNVPSPRLPTHLPVVEITGNDCSARYTAIIGWVTGSGNTHLKTATRKLREQEFEAGLETQPDCFGPYDELGEDFYNEPICVSSETTLMDCYTRPGATCLLRETAMFAITGGHTLSDNLCGEVNIHASEYSIVGHEREMDLVICCSYPVCRIEPLNNSIEDGGSIELVPKCYIEGEDGQMRPFDCLPGASFEWETNPLPFSSTDVSSSLSSSSTTGSEPNTLSANLTNGVDSAYVQTSATMEAEDPENPGDPVGGPCIVSKTHVYAKSGPVLPPESSIESCSVEFAENSSSAITFPAAGGERTAEAVLTCRDRRNRVVNCPSSSEWSIGAPNLLGISPSVEPLDDCGTSIDCLITASELCSPSKATVTTSSDILGVEQTTVTYYEIRGIDSSSGKCVFYLKTLESSASYSRETKQALLDSGKTKDEINQMEQELNQELESAKGLDGKCNLETSFLSGVLTDWKEGTYESNTFEGQDCTGSYFEFSAPQTAESDVIKINPLTGQRTTVTAFENTGEAEKTEWITASIVESGSQLLNSEGKSIKCYGKVNVPPGGGPNEVEYSCEGGIHDGVLDAGEECDFLPNGSSLDLGDGKERECDSIDAQGNCLTSASCADFFEDKPVGTVSCSNGCGITGCSAVGVSGPNVFSVYALTSEGVINKDVSGAPNDLPFSFAIRNWSSELQVASGTVSLLNAKDGSPAGVSESFSGVNVPASGIYWFGKEGNPPLEISMASVSPGEYKLLAEISQGPRELRLFDNTETSLPFVVREFSSQGIPDNGPIMVVLILGIVLSIAYARKKK